VAGLKCAFLSARPALPATEKLTSAMNCARSAGAREQFGNLDSCNYGFRHNSVMERFFASPAVVKWPTQMGHAATFIWWFVYDLVGKGIFARKLPANG
jgi:hypothetical protein